LGGVDAKGVQYEGLSEALADSDVDIRLFAKPEAFVARRMGVALATSADVGDAIDKAVKAAKIIKIS
jgi:phosphoribosylglycinamide formyltransferase 2